MRRSILAISLGAAIGCGGTATTPKGDSFTENPAPATDGGTGCTALATCCPTLPVAQDPSECDAVATTGTSTACSESLATYQMSGFCISRGDSTAPASIYLTSTLGAGTNPDSTASCNVDEPEAPFFTIGTPETPVEAGETASGIPLTLSCTVHPTGDTFEVNLAVNEGETYSITVGGSFADTPGVSQRGLSVDFTSESLGNYSESDCTFVLSTMGNPPIAAGRVWGTLTCPMISDPATSATCAATATFIIQNCSE